MKSLIGIFLFVGIAMLYISCSDNNLSAPGLNQSDQISNILDKKPAPNLIGEMKLTFIGDEESGVSWAGTIDFEGYEDDNPFQIYFYGGEGSVVKGKSYHFVESFEIYQKTSPVDSVLVLAVSDEGIEPGNIKSETPMYMSNGVVTYAYDPFEMWMGRNTHMSGVIIFDETGGMTAPGTLRIN